MARSSDINQRIVLTGAEEVRRHLDEIAKAGQKSGNLTRQSLLAATSGTTAFAGGAQRAGAASGQMRAALQNLGFQVNDIATSLASGGDAMRVFAQQGGQVFQAFQQGGGPRAVFGAAANAIAGLITPTTIAVGALGGLAVGLGLVVARAVSMQTSAQQFNVILTGMGKASKATGAELVAAADRLRDVGLAANEARGLMQQAIREGLDPTQAERIVRIGQNLNTVLGEGSLEKFIAAAARGGEPLRAFAERLGIVSREAEQSAIQLRDFESAADSSSSAVEDALRQRDRAIAEAQRARNKAIAEEERRSQSEVEELTRKRGTARQEIERASAMRIEEINRSNSERIEEIQRQSADRINDLIRERNQRRNEENQKALDEYNKKLEEATQKAFDDSKGLIDAIEQRVQGLHNQGLTPAGKAMQELGLAWRDMMNALAESEEIQNAIRDLAELVRSLAQAIRVLRVAKMAIGEGISASDAAQRLSTSSSGSEFNTGTVPTRPLARGGFVTGPGTGTSDSIFARLSNGEFVMRAAAVRTLGVDFLKALNRTPGFARGGLVETRGLLSPAGSLMNSRLLSTLAGRASRMLRSSSGQWTRSQGGTPIYLQLPSGDRIGPMMADAEVAQSVTRFARRARVASAGPAPRFVGA